MNLRNQLKWIIKNVLSSFGKKIINCIVLLTVIFSAVFSGKPGNAKADEIKLPLISKQEETRFIGTSSKEFTSKKNLESPQQLQSLPTLPMHAPFPPGFGGFYITTGSEFHKDANLFAIDFNWGMGSDVDEGAVILAAADGIVLKVQKTCSTSGYGCEVIIGHAFGYQTRYAHFKAPPLVKVGDWVSQGAPLGLLGKSGGTSSAPHLHFAVYYCTTFLQNNNYCDSADLISVQPNLEGILVNISNTTVVNSSNYSVGYEQFSQLHQDPTTLVKHQPMIDVYKKYGGQGWVFGMSQSAVTLWNNMYYQEFGPQVLSVPWMGLSSAITETNGKANFVIGPIWEKYRTENGPNGRWGKIISDSYRWNLPAASGYRTDFENGSIIWLEGNQYEYLDSSNANWIGKFSAQPNNFNLPLFERRDQYVDFSWPSTSYPEPIQSLNGFSVKYQIIEKGFISLSRIFVPALQGNLKVNVNGNTVLDVSSPNSIQSFQSSLTFGLGDQNIEVWFWQEGGKNARLSLSSIGIIPTAFASEGMISSSGEPTPNIAYAGFSPPPFIHDYPLNTNDFAVFISDATFPDGAVVVPGQTLTKTWKVKNTGRSTWGGGYQLVFTGGDQMGAPTAVDLPITAPGQEVDLSVGLTMPNQNGKLTGNWRLRHGTTYFGPLLWAKLTVNTSAPPLPPSDPSGWEVNTVSFEYPPVVIPGQTFRPRITVKVNQGQLLESRGDLLRNTDGNLYGTWPHVAVIGSVNAGQNYLFEFYANNPITAPAGEGTYESKWRVWRDGNWSGPEITIRFDVRNGGGTRPNPPALSDPGNWSVFAESSPPALCVNSTAGVQYFFQIYESHDIPESGWTNSNCWTPPGLGPYTYQWHVKARNVSTLLESDWSDPRHFSLYSTQLTMDNLEFTPGSPSSAERIKVYTCVQGFGGIGLGLKIEANTATDGSASGDWYWIHHLGKFCYDYANTGTWPEWETLPLADGDHLIRAVGYGPQGQTLVKTAIYHLNRRRPNAPALVNPSVDAWVNNQLITFQWDPAWRVNNYRLVVGTNPDPTISPLIDQTLPANTNSYQFNFASAYPNLYWRVFAINELGSSDTVRHFGIDQQAPSSSVTAFPSAVGYENAFPVTWGGSDDRSGVRWYDVQYRDGNRSDSQWVDWISQTTTISSIFIGQAGHSYYFRSRALDVAGNLEAWPVGDGDAGITIDLASRPSTPWWDAAYGNKRNLLVLNNDGNSLSSGYPIHIHFDTGTTPSSTDLYAASQSVAKGDDFRIVYNNTIELPRFVQAFESGKIDIWFNLQTGIAPNPASNASSYQLYYGNPSAINPPADINIVLPPSDDASTVGLWHFSDQTGTSFADKSGNGNNGTLFNGGWDLNGKFGSAAVFNGSSMYAEIPSSNLFNLNNFTIEGWFKLYNNATQLLLRRRMTTNTEEAYRLEIRDWKFVGNIRGGINVNSQTQLVQGRWYHLAFTYDGTTARIFVNGNLETSASFTGGVPAGTGPVILGRNSANSDYMNGQVQGLRISNAALSSFPYGSYGAILIEPSVAAGEVSSPPITGSPDLTILNLTTYPNPGGGVLVEAVVMNQGTVSTQNGFYTDLYLNHIPAGSADYSGSVRFWVNDSIDPAQTATLTTVLTDLSSLSVGVAGINTTDLLNLGTFTESSGILYAQTDSAGLVQEPDDLNNIFSTGIQICIASPDAFEGDDTYATANLIPPGGGQTRNFHAPGDRDWLKFSAVAGQSYTITTSNLGASNDTYLYLYGMDGITLIATNDDLSGTLASQIDWQPTVSGIYYILVNHWNPSVGGCGMQYTISVQAPPPPAPSLTVSKVGTGSGSIVSFPVGISCGVACVYSFAYNTVVTLTATPTSPSTFGGWSGGGCSGTGTCTVTMSSVQSVTATFTAPITGGGSTTGVFRPSNGLLYLKNQNTTGFADVAINYGTAGDYPIAGDWDGNGTATIGIYRNGSFYLRNSNTLGFADIVFAFGTLGDQPVAGDWDGDGTDTIGVYSNGQFLLRNTNSAGTADMSFYLGNPGDVGIAGDWNGDGMDTTGVFRPSNGIIFLKNANTTGFADVALNYGLSGDMPVTGDWNDDGIDTIGVYRNAQFLLRNSNTIGFADIVFALGIPGDMPIAGNWDGIP